VTTLSAALIYGHDLTGGLEEAAATWGSISAPLR
jgi:hypothetical protein